MERRRKKCERKAIKKDYSEDKEKRIKIESAKTRRAGRITTSQNTLAANCAIAMSKKDNYQMKIERSMGTVWCWCCLMTLTKIYLKSVFVYGSS